MWTDSGKTNGANDEECPLGGILLEFRVALQEEIKAADKSSANSAVPLMNGKRIAQIGGGYQYLFVVENILNVPGDTPGDLRIPGRDPIPVTVISVDGMAITLGVPCDLGPFVPNAHLQSNLAHLMRRLIERIESKADCPNKAGDRILNNLSSGEPAPLPELFRNSLNVGQRQAVCASLGRDTTFIWGPPGTGKTRTIGEIGYQILCLNESLLVVSHTNIAVDQALLKIAEHAPQDAVESGKVLRVGDSKDSVLNSKDNLLLRTHVDKRSQALAERRDSLRNEIGALIEEVKRITRILDIAEWVSIAETDIEKMGTEWSQIQEMEGELESLRGKLATLKGSEVYWENAEDESHKANRVKKDISSVGARLSEIEETVEQVQTRLSRLDAELSQAKKVMYEIHSVGWLTRKWRGLPTPEQQLAKVRDVEAQHGQVVEELDSINAEAEKALHLKQVLEVEFGAFVEKYQRDPSEILEEAELRRKIAEDLRGRINDISKTCAKKCASLQQELGHRLAALHEFDLAEVHSDSIPTMLEQIRNAYENAQEMIKAIDVAELRQRRDSANQRIRAINVEIDSVEAALKKVEELVIADASIIATTLTRTYLRDSIQNRMFDTVVLDEASMAPIPALWVAASLASKRIVLVGDYKQLPPIVLSKNEKGLAKRWLGRDIFEVAGVTQEDPWFVTLTEQHRMHPEISAIPNRLVYGGRLTDGKGTDSNASLVAWYRDEWGHDRPVLLVDTGSTNAWVTSVPRGSGSSRLNFLSATICVDIAEQLLKEDRPKHEDGNEARILIVCPYRAHARLVEILIAEQNLTREVVSGTAHSFQGSEADVVILDLVNDEPQWKVGLFIGGTLDPQAIRLLNVALTRARRRLIIVGDFKYIVSHAKKAFMGKELIPFLQENYESVDALQIVRNGLAAKAAQAQLSVSGGVVEAEQDRVVVTQEDFYRFLLHDVLHARTRIVIYSPFITQNRLAELGPLLRAAVERGVRVFVVTKARSERGKREKGMYRMLENTLSAWDITVIHKQNMHEKLVFIDEDILWEGSLNPLSFSNTVEHMERRKNKRVFDDYASTIWLDDLLNGYSDISTCPGCGREVVAREGRHEPFYWTCVVKDCWSWSIDKPPPRDGIVRCNKCGEDVEFGEWGGRACWRCIENRRHHQPVARTHLKLPEMRARIPKRELTKLERQFSVSGGTQDSSKKRARGNQRYLFE